MGEYGGNKCHFLESNSVQYWNQYNVVNKKHYVSSAMPEKCNNIVARKSRLTRDSQFSRFLLSGVESCSQLNTLDDH